MSTPVPPEVEALRLPGRKGGLVEVPLISDPHTPISRRPKLIEESTTEPVSPPNPTRIFGGVSKEGAASGIGNADFKVGAASTAEQVHRLHRLGGRIGSALNRARNRDAEPINREEQPPFPHAESSVSWGDVRRRNYNGYHDYTDFEKVPLVIRNHYSRILDHETAARSRGYPITTAFADYTEQATGPEKGVVEPKHPWPAQNEIGTTYLFDQLPTVIHPPVDPRHH